MYIDLAGSSVESKEKKEKKRKAPKTHGEFELKNMSLKTNDLFSVRGKNIVVTGGSRGIGISTGENAVPGLANTTHN